VSVRVVSGSEALECAAWVPPDMQGGAAAGAALTPAELEVLRQRAESEGRAAGFRAGLEAAGHEIAAAVARLDAVAESLARPFAGVEAQVEQELLALSFAIARQLVRRELKADPAQVVGVVRDALQALPVAARDVKVYLHPDDAALVVQQSPAVGRERAWTIVEDPMLARGGARVATEASTVDARLETRLGALVAELIGGEREVERDPGAREPDP